MLLQFLMKTLHLWEVVTKGGSTRCRRHLIKESGLHVQCERTQVTSKMAVLALSGFHFMQLVLSMTERRLSKYVSKPPPVSYNGDCMFVHCCLMLYSLCYWGFNLFYDIILYYIRLWFCNVWVKPTSWEDCQYSFSPNQWKNGVVMV